MSTTWTLVTDFARARLYREEPEGPPYLLGTRENPVLQGDSRDPGDPARDHFARELGLLLARGAVDGHCDRIVLVAPPNMIMDIRRHLVPHAKACAVESWPVDLGGCAGADIEATLLETGARA